MKLPPENKRFPQKVLRPGLGGPSLSILGMALGMLMTVVSPGFEIPRLRNGNCPGSVGRGSLFALEKEPRDVELWLLMLASLVMPIDSAFSAIERSCGVGDELWSEPSIESASASGIGGGGGCMSPVKW